jgi:hypothetical protein
MHDTVYVSQPNQTTNSSILRVYIAGYFFLDAACILYVCTLRTLSAPNSGFHYGNQLPGIGVLSPGASFACGGGPDSRQRCIITQHPLDL